MTEEQQVGAEEQQVGALGQACPGSWGLGVEEGQTRFVLDVVGHAMLLTWCVE